MRIASSPRTTGVSESVEIILLRLYHDLNGGTFFDVARMIGWRVCCTGSSGWKK